MSFQISASAPKRDITEAIETANKSYERVNGYNLLAKIPQIVEDLTEGYHEDTIIAVTVTGSQTDAITTMAINVTANPNGINPNPPRST